MKALENNRRRLLCEGSLLLVAIIWGWGFMATRIAVDSRLSASFIMMGRFVIAALVFGAVFLRHLRRNINARAVKAGILIGVFLFLGFMVQTVAMEHTSPSNAAFLTATNVVMVPFLWWVLVKKRPSGRVVAASALCLVGIGVLSVQVGQAVTVSPGDLLALACALFFACQIVLTGFFAARYDANTLTFVQLATAAALSCGFFLLLDGDYAAFTSAKGLGAVLYLGVFSTCLCYFLQTTAQKHVPAAKVALLLCTESLFGSLFSVLLGYDRLSPSLLVGGLAIMGAVVLSESAPAAGAKQAVPAAKEE